VHSSRADILSDDRRESDTYLKPFHIVAGSEADQMLIRKFGTRPTEPAAAQDEKTADPAKLASDIRMLEAENARLKALVISCLCTCTACLRLSDTASDLPYISAQAYSENPCALCCCGIWCCRVKGCSVLAEEPCSAPLQHNAACHFFPAFGLGKPCTSICTPAVDVIPMLESYTLT
jgi:hypothetical protein